MYSLCIRVLSLCYLLRATSAYFDDEFDFKHSILHSNLLNNSNYKVSLPPKMQTSVTITFDLFSINDFDEIKGHLYAVGVLYVSWSDPRLQWSYNDTGIPNISFYLKEIWRPDISLLNSINKFIVTDRELDKTTVWVNSSGSVFYAIGNVFSVSCDPDVTYFPFDIHECFLNFVPFYDIFFPSGKNTLSLIEPLFKDSDIMDEDGKWKYYSLKSCIQKLGNTNIYVATFPIRLERRWKFVFCNIIIPVLLLGHLNIFVYMIPVEAGERISFAITVLLSYTVFMIVMADSIPETSNPMPLISYFLVIKLGYSSCIAISVIIVTRFYHREDEGHISSLKYKFTLTIERIHEFICRPNDDTDVETKLVEDDDGSPETNTNDNSNASVRSNSLERTENYSTQTTIMTWSRVSKALDKLFMFVFLFLITTELILFFVVLLKSYENESDHIQSNVCSKV